VQFMPELSLPHAESAQNCWLLTSISDGPILDLDQLRGDEMTMTKHVISAVLLTAIATGCAGGNSQSAQNPETPAAPAAAPEQAPPAAPAPPAPVTRRTAPRPPAAPRSVEFAPSAPAAAPAPAPIPATPKAVFRDVTAAVGTSLSLSLVTPLSTETAKVETPVTARLRQPIVVDGFTVVPAGATLHGDVIEAERAGRVKGRSRLVIRFAELMVNGDRDPFRTEALTFEGQASKAKDATKIGAGAGIGALIGGIAGGGSGAAAGAAIGGAAGTGAVLATRGADVELAEGTELNTALASPYSVRVEVK
jgi:hypothetical protein